MQPSDLPLENQFIVQILELVRHGGYFIDQENAQIKQILSSLWATRSHLVQTQGVVGRMTSNVLRPGSGKQTRA